MSFYNIVGAFGGRPQIVFNFSPPEFSNPYYNFNLCNNLPASYIPGISDIELNIPTGYIIGSVTTSIASFIVGSCLVNGDTVKLNNYGSIIGAGGDGGIAGYSGGGGQSGGDGGTALLLYFPTTINNYGLIAGGAGGGGGSNGGETYPGCLGIGPVERWSGDGGGGGAGFNPGVGGGGDGVGSNGNNGTTFYGGAGGSKHEKGGNGGDLGFNGESSGDGENPNSGGISGCYIQGGQQFATWGVLGTRKGRAT